MKALLIVDLQNDFLTGSLAVPRATEIIEPINQLQEAFSLVIATKDWHPAGHVSFASTHKKRVGESIEVEGTLQALWPDHCLQGSWGSDFPDELHRERISEIFYKGSDPKVDSYSAFFDCAKRRSTGLEDYLRKMGVDEIVIVGLLTDYCVLYTALDGRALGFSVTMIEKDCRGIDKLSTQAALDQMRRAGVKIL